MLPRPLECMHITHNVICDFKQGSRTCLISKQNNVRFISASRANMHLRTQWQTTCPRYITFSLHVSLDTWHKITACENVLSAEHRTRNKGTALVFIMWEWHARGLLEAGSVRVVYLKAFYECSHACKTCFKVILNGGYQAACISIHLNYFQL